MGAKKLKQEVELATALLEMGFEQDPKMKFFGKVIPQDDGINQFIFLYKDNVLSFESAIATLGKNSFDPSIPKNLRMSYQRIAQKLMARALELSEATPIQKKSFLK